jgi:hypothetical protein
MRLVHGPYFLSAGQHEQDEPVEGASFKVKELRAGSILTETGKELKIDARGVCIIFDGSPLHPYVDGRRAVPAALTPDDEVTLCRRVTYGAPDTPERHRKSGVLYEPFKSHQELDGVGPGKLNHNRPNAVKFFRANEKALSDEVAELRRQNAELLDKLAQVQGGKFVAQPKTESVKGGQREKQLVP